MGDFYSSFSKRVHLIQYLFGVIVLLVFARGIYILIGKDLNDEINTILVTRPLVSLKALAAHTDKIELVQNDIENQSFAQIKKMFEDTLRLTQNSVIEIKSQESAWLELKSEMKEDRVNFEQIKNQLADVENIKDQQIIRVKELMDVSESSFVIRSLQWVGNHFVGFALGILASLIVNWIAQKETSVIGGFLRYK